jgi:hypothetical protein
MEKWGLSAKWLINWEGSESVQGKIVSFLCSRFFWIENGILSMFLCWDASNFE